MRGARPAVRALEELLAAQRPGIHRHVRRLIRDRGDADDLTQETLLRAQQQVASLKDPAALGGWLRRIATNVCTDHLRAISRRGGRGAEVAGGEAEAADLARAAQRLTPEELVDRARMNACGERYLRRLPDAYRRVIVLHDLLGLTSAEVARRLGCTPGAVKIRLHRARAQFRAALEEGCELYRDSRGALLGAPRPTRR